MFSPLFFTFIHLLHSGTSVCKNSCVRPTVRRVFRHLVALLCFCFFFFAHILLRVRITSYAIFISIPISRERERERGKGGRSKCRAKSVWRLQQRSRRHRRRDVFMAHASVWSCISASLSLFLHLTDASLPSPPLSPPFPSSLAFLLLSLHRFVFQSIRAMLIL